MKSITIAQLDPSTTDNDVEKLKILIDKVVEAAEQKLGANFDVKELDECEHVFSVIPSTIETSIVIGEDPEIECAAECKECKEEVKISLLYSDIKEMLDSIIES